MRKLVNPPPDNRELAVFYIWYLTSREDTETENKLLRDI
jgi:hypothetical protein